MPKRCTLLGWCDNASCGPLVALLIWLSTSLAAAVTAWQDQLLLLLVLPRLPLLLLLLPLQPLVLQACVTC